MRGSDRGCGEDVRRRARALSEKHGVRPGAGAGPLVADVERGPARSVRPGRQCFAPSGRPGGPRGSPRRYEPVRISGARDLRGAQRVGPQSGGPDRAQGRAAFSRGRGDQLRLLCPLSRRGFPMEGTGPEPDRPVRGRERRRRLGDRSRRRTVGHVLFHRFGPFPAPSRSGRLEQRDEPGGSGLLPGQGSLDLSRFHLPGVRPRPRW